MQQRTLCTPRPRTHRAYVPVTLIKETISLFEAEDISPNARTDNGIVCEQSFSSIRPSERPSESLYAAVAALRQQLDSSDASSASSLRRWLCVVCPNTRKTMHPMVSTLTETLIIAHTTSTVNLHRMEKDSTMHIGLIVNTKHILLTRI